jgi:hypothetical protein
MVRALSPTEDAMAKRNWDKFVADVAQQLAHDTCVSEREAAIRRGAPADVADEVATWVTAQAFPNVRAVA